MNPHPTGNDLPTPGLVIDERVMELNLARMAEYARAHNLKLRPHTKTHKSLDLARRQIAHGAAGLTVAKAGEAEVMRGACEDILVAYPALDDSRTNRLAELARGGCTVRIAIDSTRAADALADAARSHETVIDILVDMDVGYHRTGVQSPAAARTLAQHVAVHKSLRLDGLFIYPGHVISRDADQRDALSAVSALVVETLDLFHRDGFDARIVSGGSTPSAAQSHLVSGITEIRPGTYVFNDWNTASGGWCGIDDCAARFVCTVVSDAVPGKVVVDAGSKTLTSDRLMTDPQNGGFGCVVDYSDARITRLSEEHGEIDISRCASRPKLGERIWIIPNHICPCVNLQDAVWLRGADGALRRLQIEARGMIN